MRNICSQCGLTSPDGNLWCQLLDCPAGTLPLLFNYGDYLGNLKVLEQLRVLRASTLYKAERGVGKDAKTYFLKIANPGAENEAYLKREAEALRAVSAKKTGKEEYAPLPTWQPHGAVNGEDAYGKIDFRGFTRYFYLMDFVDGEFLTDTLLDNAQPWHEHVGWFMIALSEAVVDIERGTNALHANLNPDVIRVRRNGAGVPLPLLIDMGLLLAPGKTVPASEAENLLHYLHPAYTPPELLMNEKLTPTVDTYGMGLLLYQMLAGKPAFPYVQRRNEDIYADVQQVKPILTRDDLPMHAPNRRPANAEALNEIVQRSVVHDHPKRYTDPTEFRSALYALYKEPEDRREVNPDQLFSRLGYYVVVGSLGLFLVFFVIVLISAFIRGAG